MATASTSISLQNKKHKSLEVGRADGIGILPDPILAHILSFLPTEDAVKTILLKVFGNLWTSSSTLDFKVSVNDLDYLSHRKDKWYINYIDQVLLHHGSTIDKFSLTYAYAFGLKVKNTSLSNRYPAPSHILDKLDSWICYAVKKKVKIFELDMLDHNLSGPIFCYSLPNILLNNDALTEMKLVSCMINKSAPFSMKSLKNLSLITVSLSDVTIADILSGCPMLEHLSLTRCPGLYNLNLTSTRLEYLVVTLGEGDPSEFNIFCPNIKSIKIAGSIGRVHLKNATSVVDATLEFFSGGRYSIHEYVRAGLLLDELMNAKFLTLCDWCILVFAMRTSMKGDASTLTCKSVTLETKLTKWHMLGIASLLNNSPYLEMLTIHVEQSEDVMWLKALGIYGRNPWFNKKWLGFHDFDGNDFWSTQHSFPCLKNHLKCVKVYGCVEDLHMMELVKLLLRGSLLLERMIIISEHKPRGLLDISQRLNHFPKASNDVVIVIA